MDRELKPRGIGDRLNDAFDMYKRNFVVLLTIVAIVVLPVQLVVTLVADSLVPDATDPDSIDAGEAVAALGYGFLLSLLVWVAQMVAAGAAIKALVDERIGGTPNWQDSVAFGFSRLGSLLLGSLLFAIGVAVGLVFFIIPGIILAVSWAVFVPAIVVEGSTGGAALGRSNRLVSGFRWPVFGFLIVVFLVTGIVNGLIAQIVTTIFDAALDDLLAAVVGSLVGTMITAPFGVSAIVAQYLDLRARKEDLDLATLSQALTNPGPIT